MLIYSTFTDYYDKFKGNDPTCVFMRERRVIQKKRTQNVYAFKNILKFCDEVFPYIRYDSRKSDKIYNIYNLEMYEKFIETEFDGLQCFNAVNFKEQFKLREKLGVSQLAYDEVFNKKDITKFLLNAQIPTYIKGELVYLSSPYTTLILPNPVEGAYPVIQLHNEYGVIINPSLKDLEFYKIYDAFTTFTKIESYISGVLGRERIPEIRNEDMLVSKGFDLKGD